MISPVQSSVQVTATGYIVPQVVSKVGAHAVGRLARVLVKEGDSVKAGQVIAELDAADQRSAVAAAGSRIAVAQANVATARANLEEVNTKIGRDRPLVASGAESKSVLDDLLTQQASLEEQVKAAQASVSASEAERGTLDVDAHQRTIIAPIDGSRGDQADEAGRGRLAWGRSGRRAGGLQVPPRRGRRAGESSFAREDRWTLPRSSSTRTRTTGLRARSWSSATAWNRSKATLVVKVKFTDDMEGVLPEMSVRASFLSAPITDDALKAPPKKVVAADAVVDRNGRKVVFVLDNGAVHAVPVTTGAVIGSSVELLDGPVSGVRVVSAHAACRFVDGSRR